MYHFLLPSRRSRRVVRAITAAQPRASLVERASRVQNEPTVAASTTVIARRLCPPSPSRARELTRSKRAMSVSVTSLDADFERRRDSEDDSWSSADESDSNSYSAGSGSDPSAAEYRAPVMTRVFHAGAVLSAAVVRVDLVRTTWKTVKMRNERRREASGESETRGRAREGLTRATRARDAGDADICAFIFYSVRVRARGRAIDEAIDGGGDVRGGRGGRVLGSADDVSDRRGDDE